MIMFCFYNVQIRNYKRASINCTCAIIFVSKKWTNSTHDAHYMNKTDKNKGFRIVKVGDCLYRWVRSFCDLIRSLSHYKECNFHVNHLYLKRKKMILIICVQQMDNYNGWSSEHTVYCTDGPHFQMGGKIWELLVYHRWKHGKPCYVKKP